jgi:single-stranded-DNA-specific exonuclease
MTTPARSVTGDLLNPASAGPSSPPSAPADAPAKDDDSWPRLPPLTRVWVTRAEHDVAAVSALHASLKLPEPLCRLLAMRGFSAEEDAKDFLKPRLDRLLDPGRLAGIGTAVERLSAAIDRRETILVHGDYDVDGICSTALYTRVLRALDAHVVPFTPHRLRDGYDLTSSGVNAAVAAGARVILTADCGTVAFPAVEAAKQAGIDVIITDHHTPGPTLPDAVAVVNPNRADCDYPDKGLAGVGVAFKVCQALSAARGRDPEWLRWYLDLVALATIADLAPLRGENRIFTRYGLRLLRETRNPGLRALMKHADVDPSREIAAGQVSHVLAPRINAVGRLGDAARGVRLLLTEDEREADALAAEMETENRTRRAIDRETLRQALVRLERDFDPARDYGVVLAARDWHPGVIGIVASRVVEHVHRPTILIALDEDGARGRGSARSIPGFHLYEAIRDCGDLLERFGGHRQAAGLEVLGTRIDAFTDAFNRRAASVLEPEDLKPRVHIDLEIDLDAASIEIVDLLRHFGPFGMGNPSPVMAARDVGLARPARTVGRDHARLLLKQNGSRLSAIGFGMADRFAESDEESRYDIAFQLRDDEWDGRRRVEAKLIDVHDAR